jgi:hypothetical protein
VRTLTLVNLLRVAHAAFSRREQHVPVPAADDKATEPAGLSNTGDAASAAETAPRAIS